MHWGTLGPRGGLYSCHPYSQSALLPGSCVFWGCNRHLLQCAGDVPCLSANSVGRQTVNAADVGGADVLGDVGPMSKWARPGVTCHISPAGANTPACANGPVGPIAYLDWEAPVEPSTSAGTDPRRPSLNGNISKDGFWERRTNTSGDCPCHGDLSGGRPTATAAKNRDRHTDCAPPSRECTLNGRINEESSQAISPPISMISRRTPFSRPPKMQITAIIFRPQITAIILSSPRDHCGIKETGISPFTNVSHLDGSLLTPKSANPCSPPGTLCLGGDRPGGSSL